MSEYTYLKIPKSEIDSIDECIHCIPEKSTDCKNCINQYLINNYEIPRIDPRLGRVYEQVTGLLQFVQLAGTAELIYKVLKEVIEDE